MDFFWLNTSLENTTFIIIVSIAKVLEKYTVIIRLQFTWLYISVQGRKGPALTDEIFCSRQIGFKACFDVATLNGAGWKGKISKADQYIVTGNLYIHLNTLIAFPAQLSRFTI